MSEYKTFLITDISGSAVLGLNSGFTTTYLADGASISGSSVTISEISDGFYQALVTPVPAGNLTLRLEHSDPANYIAPDWHEWTSNLYDTDDIYSVVQQQTVSPVPYDYSTRFGEYTISIKEADDFYEVMNVPIRYLPLTGWTNWTVQAYPEEKLLVSSTPAISGGTYGVTVISESLGTLQVGISKEIFTNKIPDGVVSVPIYADIQATDSNSKKRTVVTIKFVVTREFNSN